MGHYNHSILVDANIMVLTNCPIIGEQVAVTLLTSPSLFIGFTSTSRPSGHKFSPVVSSFKLTPLTVQ